MVKKKRKKTRRKKHLFDGLPSKHPLFGSKKTIGQKAADSLTKWAGSWTFIITLFIFIGSWVYLNMAAFIKQWDPWPFIILNLCLSCLAAIQAPIILMSQNREAQKDRLRASYDYSINKKAEKEISEIQDEIREIKVILLGKKNTKKLR